MFLQEELEVMIAAEEKRLGVGSAEFMERHREIMEMIDRLMKKGEEENAKTIHKR